MLFAHHSTKISSAHLLWYTVLLFSFLVRAVRVPFWCLFPRYTLLVPFRSRLIYHYPIALRLIPKSVSVCQLGKDTRHCIRTQPNENVTIVLYPPVLKHVKVVGVLPVAVDAINDPPEVVIPHRHVVKFGGFEVWNRYLQTRAGLSAFGANLTMTILTDTASGQITLDGMDTENVDFQVTSSAVAGFEHRGAHPSAPGETIVGFRTFSTSIISAPHPT